ncbi:MAG: DUF1634 domain-containing protein [Acidibrevibacterium sp.]|uniref:DUF1634 domain-containing protein n=1 Tax=Acidibrevibacterium sp. TaxID=2606776 RepID=UPI003D059863
MGGRSGRHPRLEPLLARTLTLGTWLASAIILLGFGLTLIDGRAAGVTLITAGIAIFLLLPVLRVLLMLIVFVGEGDFRYGAIAALVLAIIALGAALGLRIGGSPG